MVSIICLHKQGSLNATLVGLSYGQAARTASSWLRSPPYAAIWRCCHIFFEINQVLVPDCLLMQAVSFSWRRRVFSSEHTPSHTRYTFSRRLGFRSCVSCPEKNRRRTMVECRVDFRSDFRLKYRKNVRIRRIWMKTSTSLLTWEIGRKTMTTCTLHTCFVSVIHSHIYIYT